MSLAASPSLSAFLKGERIARGSAPVVADALRELPTPERASDLLVFDDETGRQVDLDLRVQAPTRSRGRPALGVEAKEVTLLPRHWEWLAQQRGGASAGLRRLVEDAIRSARKPAERYDAAYRFLSAIAGDLPGFEDAMREMYAGRAEGFDRLTAGWPEAIRSHGRELAFGEA